MNIPEQKQKSFLDVLIERPHEPASGPIATSQAAAESIRHATSSIRTRIMNLFREPSRREYGWIADEIEQELDLPSQTVAPRLKELRDDGLIARTGEKRLTRRGRGAFVETITSLALNLDRLAADGSTRIEPVGNSDHHTDSAEGGPR